MTLDVPGVLAIIAAVSGAAVAIIREIKNQGKAAVAKTTQVHEATAALSAQNTKIAEQTDGQLGKLIKQNEELLKQNHELSGEKEHLHKYVTTLMAILAAREGKAVPVRPEDGGSELAADDRRATDKHPTIDLTDASA